MLSHGQFSQCRLLAQQGVKGYLSAWRQSVSALVDQRTKTQGRADTGAGDSSSHQASDRKQSDAAAAAFDRRPAVVRLLPASEPARLMAGQAITGRIWQQEVEQLVQVARDASEPTAQASPLNWRPVYQPWLISLHLRAALRLIELHESSRGSEVLVDADDDLLARTSHVMRDVVEPLDQLLEPMAIRLGRWISHGQTTLTRSAVLWYAACVTVRAQLSGMSIQARHTDDGGHRFEVQPSDQSEIAADLETAEYLPAILEAVFKLTHQEMSCATVGPRPADSSLDAWTYDELTGLHALGLINHAVAGRAWDRRLRQIVKYHEIETQPDNTTTQPWAMFVFASLGTSMTFAVQQLHDATTQLSLGRKQAAANTLADQVAPRQQPTEADLEAAGGADPVTVLLLAENSYQMWIDEQAGRLPARSSAAWAPQ